MDEKQKSWDLKFRDRKSSLSTGDEFLEAWKYSLRCGTVLDLACGDGRNAIALAKQGFTVTGVDFSREALKRLTSFAKRENVCVTTIQRDVEANGALSGLGSFDNIIVIHFKPPVHTFHELCGLLRPNGLLLMTSFNMKQSLEHNFPKRYCYIHGEFSNLNKSVKVLEYTSYETAHGYLDGYVFEKEESEPSL